MTNHGTPSDFVTQATRNGKKKKKKTRTDVKGYNAEGLIENCVDFSVCSSGSILYFSTPCSVL